MSPITTNGNRHPTRPTAAASGVPASTRPTCPKENCQLISVLQEYEVNPQIYFTQVSDPFMVYIKISLISAAAISAPWMIWQLWRGDDALPEFDHFA